MLKDTMLYLARQDAIRQFVIRNAAARKMARRFVAGETLDEAMSRDARAEWRAYQLSRSITSAKTSPTPHEAKATAQGYIQILDRIAVEGAEANISVKPTALGLDIDYDLCQRQPERVLRERA